MARISLRQMTGDSPTFDDFYCKAFLEKRKLSKESLTNEASISIFLDRFSKGSAKQQASAKKRQQAAEALSSALGKGSIATVRSTRKQPIVSAEATNQLLSTAAQSIQLGALVAIERLYRCAFQREFSKAGGRADGDFCADVAQKELNLRQTMMEREELIRLIQILNFPKGRRAIHRIVPILASENQFLVLFKIAQSLAYLEMLIGGTVPEVNSFVNLVISPFVPVIEGLPRDRVLATLSALLKSVPSISTILSSKIVLVFLCLLLTRLEQCDEDPRECNEVLQLYFSLEGNLQVLFANSESDPEVEYYAWQFAALLTTFLLEEQKKELVFELRERVLESIRSKDPKRIANLNFFLTVLGLDASQIKIA